MGLLEEWDRRNQRTAEWKLHGAEQPPERLSWPWLVLFVLGVSVAALRRVLDDVIGFGWTMGLLLLGTVGCLLGAVVEQRRRRRAWEASRRQEPGGP